MGVQENSDGSGGRASPSESRISSHKIAKPSGIERRLAVEGLNQHALSGFVVAVNCQGVLVDGNHSAAKRAADFQLLDEQFQKTLGCGFVRFRDRVQT